jgi:hypothetical protein
MSGHGVGTREVRSCDECIIFVGEHLAVVHFCTIRSTITGLACISERLGHRQWQHVIILAFGSHILCLIPPMFFQSYASPKICTNECR